jgi:hypothetical protein
MASCRHHQGSRANAPGPRETAPHAGAAAPESRERVTLHGERTPIQAARAPHHAEGAPLGGASAPRHGASTDPRAGRTALGVESDEKEPCADDVGGQDDVQLELQSGWLRATPRRSVPLLTRPQRNSSWLPLVTKRGECRRRRHLDFCAPMAVVVVDREMIRSSSERAPAHVAAFGTSASAPLLLIRIKTRNG